MYIGALAVAGMALAYAGTVTTPFADVDGPGVRRDGDRGAVLHEPEDPTEVTVNPGPGWHLANPNDATVTHHVGETNEVKLVADNLEGTATIIITDDWAHTCDPTNWEEHVQAPTLVVGASHRLCLYADPEIGVFLETNFTARAGEDGKHIVHTKYEPCRHPDCRARVQMLKEEEEPVPAPDKVKGTITATAPVLPGAPERPEGIYLLAGAHELTYSAPFSLDCVADLCKGGAVTNVTWNVCKLSVTNTSYLGLDLTDAGKLTNATGFAEAVIEARPGNTTASYYWEFIDPVRGVIGGQDDAKGTAELESARPALPSATYQGDYVRCAATLTETNPPDGHAPCTASATATNAITVVKVDVQIDGVAEEMEETKGAFIPYVPDGTNGDISVEGVNKSATVRFICAPDDLPPNERVRVSAVGPAELYQKLPGGKLVKVVSTNYFANEISRLEFVLHGHVASDFYKDGTVEIEHPTSGAKDRAKYTSVKVNVEITDFPTRKLLGEDKEEIPGAFIPYAADWAFAETPSNDEDIPFGLAAQEKLVNVYVSYEPADLPEEEDPNMKFLAFEAPSASLYLAMGAAGMASRWKEFTDWWNSCSQEWSMTFQGKMRLLLHGHEKSKRPRDREIRVTHPRSGATDVAKYTVFHVDLDIDSDNDLSIENVDGFEDAIEEREPGKIISYDQSGICPEQDYRVPLRLRAWGGETNAVVRLDADSSSPHVAEIYRSGTGDDKLNLPFYFPADSIPSLYVDGVTSGTISFTATLVNPPEGVSATSSVRPIPGIELAEDKVSALIIQPISFAPGRGRHAGVWISDPCMDQKGNTNRAMRTANRFVKVAKSVGFAFEDHEEWCVDWTDGYDDDPGDLTLAHFKKMANCGLVLFKGHGNKGRNFPVLFTDTLAGELAASKWCAGETGMSVRPCREPYGTFQGVRCDSSWYAANWRLGLNLGNAIVFWQSCHSADGSGSSSVVQAAGGRWCVAWGDVVATTGVITGTVNDVESVRMLNRTLGAMSKNPNARSAALALEAGSVFMYENCKTIGNPWTTLCPAPIPGAGYFPRDVVKKNTPALGCMILDTFIDDSWAPVELIKTSCGESIDGDITPYWLHQEGCSRPFGVLFRILKDFDQSVEVTASHRLIVNSGVSYHLSFIRSGIEEVDNVNWDVYAPGRPLDANGVAPNDKDLIWRY